MSFRLHRGPKLLTLFHDAGSPSSQRILSKLQSRIQPIAMSEVDSHSASPATEYLRDAASNNFSLSAAFELEVVDKARATPDQWNIIGSYLSKNKRSQVEELKGEEGAFLVDWDDGKVMQTEDSVEKLLSGMKGNEDDSQSKGSWWSRLTS